VITGVTAGDYVRRRRLSRAALELASGDAKIIDLACATAMTHRMPLPKPSASSSTARRPRRAGREFASTPTHQSPSRSRSKERMPWKSHRDQTRRGLTGVSIRTKTTEGQCMQEIPLFWQRSMQDGSFAKLQALVLREHDRRGRGKRRVELPGVQLLIAIERRPTVRACPPARVI